MPCGCSVCNLDGIKMTVAKLSIRTVGLALALFLGINAKPVAAKIAISFAGINPRQTPLWIAEEQNFFAKHGVDADVVYIRTGPIQVAAVSTGATQIAYAGAASTLGAVGNGTDLRAI